MFVTESNFTELKQGSTTTLAKEIVAFLNSEPGSIYIGINRNREVIGIDEADVDESMRIVSDIITDQISPRCIEFVRQHLESIEGKNVIQVDVEKGNRLYYIKKYGLSEAGCFVRNGSTCKSLSPDEIMHRYIQSLNIPEKDITEMPSTRKRLSFRILKNYLISNGIHISEDTFEENFHLRNSKGEYNYMAEILADANDIVVNVAVFASEDRTKYLRREEFGGKCLLLAMEEALHYVESLNQTYVVVGRGPRKEKKMFDDDAFEQAWINACVHNKWSESDNPGIYIYSNRMEIESFGGIPKELTKEQFLTGKSKPVNPRLFSIFSKCHFSEESGHGVPTVVSVYGEKSYYFSDHYIDVTIPFQRQEQADEEYIPETTQKHPRNARHEIFDLLKANPSLSRKEIVMATGLTDGSVRNHIERLKKEGLIKHSGPTKGGYWIISSKKSNQ